MPVSNRRQASVDFMLNGAMRSLIFSVVVLFYVIGQSGCKSCASSAELRALWPSQPREDLQCDFDALTTESALKLATDFARRKGCDMSKYKMIDVTFDGAGGSWSVYFATKEPAPSGEFSVVILREARVILAFPGE